MEIKIILLIKFEWNSTMIATQKELDFLILKMFR